MNGYRTDVLNLPILPLEWSRGDIEINGMTTLGGTVVPLTSGESYTGTTIEMTGETFGMSWNEVVIFRRIAEDMREGKDTQAYFKTDTEHFKFVYVPWEEYKNYKGTGELIEAAIRLNEAKRRTYPLTSKGALTAFEEFAKVGKRISEGEEPIEALVHFFRSYGVPEDRERNDYDPDHFYYVHTNSDDPGVLFSQAKTRAELAHTCSSLWGLIQNKEHQCIADMASIIERDSLSYASFFNKMNLIPISPPPKKGDYIWSVHAKNWLYSVTVQQIMRMYVETVGSEGAFTIGITPGGLRSAMWLAFATKIYRADNPHEGMRQCKQGGKFHGCGEWYYQDGPEDRSNYCPSCRKKAGAERVARHRMRN